MTVGPGTDGDGRPMLDQAFDGDSLDALRAAVTVYGLRAGLSEDRVGDLVLAAHELAANAVRHGAGRGRLRAWCTPGVLRCEVTDDGAPHASGFEDGASSPDPAKWDIDPGHGLWVVCRVADQTSLQGSSSGTVAAISFTLGPPA